MRSSEFPSQTCSVARSLEIVGEWWTLLVIREAFFGTRRFSDFATHLGIAKNVLSDRLAKLVEAGVLERKPVVGRGNPLDYALTPKGKDLFPAIVALMQWGDRYAVPEAGPAVLLEHRGCGGAVDAHRVCEACGARLSVRDAQAVPGPGAPPDHPLLRRAARSHVA